MIKHTISYHEDQYRMIEFVPKSNFFFSKKYINEIKDDSILEDAEYGFSSINIVNELPKKVIDERILFSKVDEIISSLAENSTTDIKRGYSNSFSTQKNIKAWGLEYSAIFVEYTNQFVKSIWILETGGEFTIQSDYAEKLREVIFNIGRDLDLILIDWNKDLIINTSNFSKVTEYLTDILKYQL